MSKQTRAEWLLERVQLGELPPALAPEAKSLLETPEGQAKLAELQKENDSLLQTLPPPAFAKEVDRRHARRRKAKARSSAQRVAFFTVPAFAAVAVVLVALGLPRVRMGSGTPGEAPPESIVPIDHSSPHSSPGVQVSPGDRIKGLHPQLVLYRQQSVAVERLEPGATVRAGDVLRVFYVAAGAPQGLVLSIDGGGGVTVHWPRGAERSAALTSGAEVGLPNSYRLDAAPGFERFFFITATQPFPLGAAVTAARALAATSAADHAPLPLPRGLEQSSLLVRKAAVP